MAKTDGYYIGTEAECLAYDAKVIAGQNYQGVTTRWAEPRQHPSNGTYAIVKHINYQDDAMQHVETLDSTWSPDDIQDAEIIE